MGGGGGAGTTNNGTSDNTTYANNSALACSAANGACSSGAPGGGIIILRANYITGSGTITANGGHGYNVQNDSGGGGGAGGSVVIYSYSGGSANVSVNGGDGGNAWRAQAPGSPYPGERHGPGGGGGGGFIAYSPSSLSITMSYSSGISGQTTTAGDSYGSTSSSGGYATFNAPAPPGARPGAECVPDLSTSVKTLVDVNGGEYSAGDTLQYSIIIKETKGNEATGVSVSDTINANLTGVTITSCPSGATCSYSAGVLNVTGITFPPTAP